MPSPIKVLLADDSAPVRRLLSSMLAKNDGIEVVGAARHGKEVLEMIGPKKPDIILLDVEMPVMDGIDALRQIRRTDKRIPVIMFSSLTTKGAEATLEALSLGASDYVAKPSGTANVQEAINYINTKVIPTIQQWGRRAAGSQGPIVRSGSMAKAGAAAPQASASAPARPRKTSGPIDVVVIGSSTGGPNALVEIVSKLPADLSVPVLIVQHMPTIFTKLLAERLDRSSALKVTEAAAGDSILRGHVLIAPGDHHMTVKSSAGRQKDAPVNSCRPAVDVLFKSVTQVYGGRALAVILTGMGRDGTEGCRVLGDRGAFVLAQDEASCVVYGMPRAVAEAGLVDKLLPLDQIHREIMDHADSGRRKPALATT